MSEHHALNVMGTPLKGCGCEPLTGFYRDGFCHTGDNDLGKHTLCAVVTEDFLLFSQRRGNDLSTPRPEFGFPGLKPGDSWCLCITRWLEAYMQGVAPPVKLAASHFNCLEYATLEQLRQCEYRPKKV